MIKKSYGSAEIIKILKKEGFVLDRIKENHHIFLNPVNNKRAIVPHPKNDLPFGTSKGIFKQAGIEQF